MGVLGRVPGAGLLAGPAGVWLMTWCTWRPMRRHALGLMHPSTAGRSCTQRPRCAGWKALSQDELWGLHRPTVSARPVVGCGRRGGGRGGRVLRPSASAGCLDRLLVCCPGREGFLTPAGDS